MKKATLVISALALCLLAKSVQAEPWEYTGSVQLSFPNGSMPIDFTVPLYGVGHRSANAPYTFSLSMTQIVDVAETLVGSIVNPIPLVMGELPTFVSIFLGDFKLYPGAFSTEWFFNNLYQNFISSLKIFTRIEILFGHIFFS